MRTRREPSQAPILVIELAGAPGAGKTSLLPAVRRACETVGLHPYTVQEAARPFAERTVAGRVARHLPRPLRRKALWAIFSVGRAVGAARLALRRPTLALHVARTQWRRPAASDVAARRVMHWYVRMAGAYVFLRRRGRPGEALIIDEGFVHRAVQLHASAVERPERRRIARYVSTVPASDLVVVVRAPVATCQRRVRARGAWARLAHRDGEAIDRLVANAHAAIELAAGALRGVRPLVEIQNGDDLGRAEIALKAQLETALSGAEAASPSGPREVMPRLRVPRVARVVNGVTARRRPPVIAPERCAQVLSRYGLTLTRTPENIPFGQRNHNVVVTTPAGCKVLRRYRGIATPDSVAHEHAVLIELERRGFPAVRLQRTADGDTVVADSGHLYALFEFEDGANLTSYLLPGRSSRARILTTAGGTLARLHHELAEFAPTSTHHLGYDPASGERTHDLAWYLEALAELPTRDPLIASRHHSRLAARSTQLASWLTALHDRLERASLPRITIHGDYGVHNLLFRSDGVAVVTDFELARREWRLVDLIIVLSRIPVARGQSFLAGYRQREVIADDEWRHLPDVWQYYRLTGAIQSWHNHFAYGGEQRLATAGARVAEADWAQAQAGSLWR